MERGDILRTDGNGYFVLNSPQPQLSQLYSNFPGRAPGGIHGLNSQDNTEQHSEDDEDYEDEDYEDEDYEDEEEEEDDDEEEEDIQSKLDSELRENYIQLATVAVVFIVPFISRYLGRKLIFSFVHKLFS